MNFNWILEIRDCKTHIKNVLQKHDDLGELYKIITTKNNDEAFVEVYECFLKTAIRFPENPINELKKIYVLQNLDKPVATTARKLKVDEATVYAWIRTIKGTNKNLQSKKEILKDLLD